MRTTGKENTLSWRKSGSSGLLSLFRLVGSLNKRDKTKPRTGETSLKPACFFGYLGIA